MLTSCHYETSQDGGPDWRIQLRSDKSYLVPKTTVLVEYMSQSNKLLCFYQPIKSHIGTLSLAAINILFTELSWIFYGHWSLSRPPIHLLHCIYQLD